MLYFNHYAGLIFKIIFKMEFQHEKNWNPLGYRRSTSFNGYGFTILVKDGQEIAAGDPLAKMDLKAIQAAGKQTAVMVLFPEYKNGFAIKNKDTEVNHGYLILQLNK